MRDIYTKILNPHWVFLWISIKFAVATSILSKLFDITETQRVHVGNKQDSEAGL